MTREHKVALMVGFALVLVVGILVADHFSKASQARVNADLASSTPHEYGRYAVAEPAMPSPIPSVRQADPTPAADDGLFSDPSFVDKPPVFDFVMGTRPELAADPINSFASAGAAIRNGIERFGLDQSPPALRIDRPVESGPSDPLLRPQVRTEPTAPPAGVLPPARATELPVSRGRMTRHEVVAGDNLTKIAARYYTDRSLWRQLETYNSGRIGKDGVIRVGVTLLIPPKEVLLGQASLATEAVGAAAARAAAAEPPKPAATAPARTPTKTPARPAPRTYTVKPGDTLLMIAQRQLGTTRRWTEIRDMNKSKIDDLDSIQVGLVLAMPTE